MADGAGPAVAIEALTVAYGTTTAVQGASLAIPGGSFVALVGESGSGKSTLLKAINRLAVPSQGRVLIDGRDVAQGPAHLLRRSIGYVFQGVGLFGHMSVAANIAAPARVAGRRLDERRVADLLAMVGLDPALAARMPHQLSGGQAQRVGFARALASDTKLMLLDEPFGALDPVTRHRIATEYRALHDRFGLTTLMVTHDMAEALIVADRVVVMAGGALVADAAPADLLRGRGGEVAQALVAVPRDQAAALQALERGA